MWQALPHLATLLFPMFLCVVTQWPAAAPSLHPVSCCRMTLIPLNHLPVHCGPERSKSQIGQAWVTCSTHPSSLFHVSTWIGVWEGRIYQKETRVLFFYPHLRTCLFYLLYLFLKYILLIMLLQLSQSFLLCPPLPGTLIPSSNPPLSSCQWVMHGSSLVFPFPVLFLTFPCLFCTYHLCFLLPVLFPHSSLCPSPLITLQVISISLILFLC